MTCTLALASAMLAAATIGGVVAVDPYPTIPVFASDKFIKTLNTTDNGVLQQVVVPSIDGSAQPQQDLLVLHLFGSPMEMGHAHGLLLGHLAAEFLMERMPEFFRQQFESVDTMGLPAWLVKLFDESVVPAAPEVFDIALEYVYSVQKEYLLSSPSHVIDELKGMAKGLCESGAIGLPQRRDGSCDEEKLSAKIIRFNLLPELIRMSCSIVGAVDKATPDGGLNQLRALDFGGGPFANYSLLSVYHPSAGNGNAFASLGFVGFANLVTGVSEYVGVSEKVHMVYDNGTGLEPGTYKGRAVSMVMREMIQFMNSTQEVIEYARAADRTWSVFLGFGDVGNNFDVLQYREKEVDVFGWENITEVTHSVTIPNITYVDRHPQPTHDPDMMPTLLKANYGNLSLHTFAQLPQQLGPTGDVHAAVFDYMNQQMLVSVGKVDANGTYGENNEGMAAKRPFIQFDLNELWHFKPSTETNVDPAQPEDNSGAGCGHYCKTDADCDPNQPCNHCENMILHQCVT